MGKLMATKIDAQLIGQFGVGFYSGFIGLTKSPWNRAAGCQPERGRALDEQRLWATLKCKDITRPQRGTSVIPYLRDGVRGIPQRLELKQLISKYRPHQPAHPDGKGRVERQRAKARPGAMVKTGEWETVNKASALWTRPKKDITTEQYQEFYKIHQPRLRAAADGRTNRVEGNTEYTQLLFIPSKAPFDLYQRDKHAGIKLYVKRVFIMDDAEAPGRRSNLRFGEGRIDLSDLPLNVSAANCCKKAATCA